VNLITWIMRALGWPAPAVRAPRRKLRATCEHCERSIAVRGNGKFYAHTCETREARYAAWLVKQHQRSRAIKAKEVPS